MSDPDSIIVTAVAVSTLVTLAVVGSLTWFRARSKKGFLRGLFTGGSVLVAAASVGMVEWMVERLNSTRGTPDAIFIDVGFLKLAPIVMTLLLLAIIAWREKP